MNSHDITTFIKYTAVGIVGLILDITVLYLLVEYTSIDVLLAAALSFMLAIINNFTFHKLWTFKDHSKHVERQFLSFFIISIANLGLTVLFMWIFTDLLQIWYIVSKLLTATIVLVFSYILNRMWTFKNIKISS